MPRGGKRQGAGRPLGSVNASTITKEAAREALRQIVLAKMERLVQAQIDASLGISHFLLRDPKTGQFKRLENVAEIEAALNADNAEEGSTYYIHTKDPSTQAFTDLMNRALDKPKEQEQTVDLTAKLTITWDE